MQKKNDAKALIDEIRLLIKYAVSEEEYNAANAVVDKYRRNRVALSVLREFYSTLPEAREEALTRIVSIDMQQDVFLLGVRTGRHDYIFMANGDGAGNLGEFQEEFGDEEAFSFFGYPTKASFLSSHPDITEFQDFAAVLEINTAFCPVCKVAVGENHHLGCPVEVCPWCFGQLNKCNCRFDQLGKEEMVDEEDLERFECLLEEKGRIGFAPGQGPSYPVAGKGEK